MEKWWWLQWKHLAWGLIKKTSEMYCIMVLQKAWHSRFRIWKGRVWWWSCKCNLILFSNGYESYAHAWIRDHLRDHDACQSEFSMAWRYVLSHQGGKCRRKDNSWTVWCKNHTGWNWWWLLWCLQNPKNASAKNARVIDAWDWFKRRSQIGAEDMLITSGYVNHIYVIHISSAPIWLVLLNRSHASIAL